MFIPAQHNPGLFSPATRAGVGSAFRKLDITNVSAHRIGSVNLFLREGRKVPDRQGRGLLGGLG
jgi:hypothetical protein